MDYILLSNRSLKAYYRQVLFSLSKVILHKLFAILLA